MKAKPGKRPLTFGDVVAGGYRAWGRRKAKGMIRLAIKLQMIEFRGQQRFVLLSRVGSGPSGLAQDCGSQYRTGRAREGPGEEGGGARRRAEIVQKYNSVFMRLLEEARQSLAANAGSN
jgi:hypothetical protein